MSHVSEIVRRYRDKGLHGKELRAAVIRHARLLTPLDKQIADNLRDARLIGERRYAEPRREEAEREIAALARAANP